MTSNKGKAMSGPYEDARTANPTISGTLESILRGVQEALKAADEIRAKLGTRSPEKNVMGPGEPVGAGLMPTAGVINNLVIALNGQLNHISNSL